MSKKDLVLERISISRGYLLLLLSVVFVIMSLSGLPAHSVIVILTILLVIYSVPFMDTFPKIMTFIMFGFGHYLYFTKGADSAYWQAALVKNLPLVALFVSVPLFSYPLRNGGYVHYITALSKRLIKSPRKLYLNILVGTMALASFMNLGAARINFELFERFMNGKDHKFYTRALAQGFTLAMCWSPNIAGAAIVLSVLKLSIFPLVLWGLLLVATGILVSFILVYKEARDVSMFPEAPGSTEIAGTVEEVEIQGKGLEMSIVFILMFLSIFVLDRFLEVNLVIIISIVAFIYPVIWSVCIKRVRAFFSSLDDYKVNVLPRLHNEAILFIAAAFFADMIKLTSFSEKLMDLYTFVNQLTPILVIFITILIIVIPAILGVHQILMVSILATSISVSSLSITAEAFGLAMLAAWSLSTASSPVSGLNLTLGNLLNEKPYIVGSWSMKYVPCAMIAFTIVIYLIDFLVQ